LAVEHNWLLSLKKAVDGFAQLLVALLMLAQVLALLEQLASQ
jgi:hypothetical protein